MRHRHLKLLGPDVLSECLPLDEIILRFRAFPELPIGVAVMDQRLCTGIGNIYKSELLFMEGIDPRHPVGRLTDDQLRRLMTQCRTWMRRNLGRGRRRTRWEPGPSHWVYGRSGEHCLRCDQLVHMVRQGQSGRSTYFCSSCQVSDR